MIDYTILGKRIRTARKTMCVTQEKISEALDISLSFYGHIERGTRKASLETIYRICQKLNISLDEVMGLAGTKSEKDFMLAMEIIDEAANEIRRRYFIAVSET